MRRDYYKKKDWKGLALRRKNGVWRAMYDHPTERTKARRTLADGEAKVYEVPRRVELVLRREDQSPISELDEAREMAEGLYADLVARRQEVRVLGTGVTPEVRYPIVGSVDDWLQRPNLKAASRVTLEHKIAPFLQVVKEAGLSYLDEVTFQHGEILRKTLEASGKSPATLNGELIAAKSFLEWCRGKLRLSSNPFTVGKLEGFQGRQKRSKLRYLDPKQRANVFACCESLQETLIVGLTMLLGLRAGEAVHLTWGSYLSDLEVPELDVQHSEPDEDDPVGWDPKTGERVVAVIWPEVRDMLNDWWVATPYGRDAEDRILVNPRDAKPYKTLPEKLRTRIKSKVEGWSYQAGRRIAATLAVVHSERLTGREWNSRDHEAQFGHSHIVAQSYYQDVQRTHRIRRYEEEALKPSSATVQHSGEHHAGLSIILAQRTLNHLLAVDRRSRSKLAEAISVSETAIRKFSHGAPKSIPGWYWAAIDALVP